LGSDRVALVAVGERSLEQEGRWPWPRQRLAHLLDALADLGVRAIGLDMGFFEPDQRLEEAAVAAVVQAAQAGKPLALEEVYRRFHPDHQLAAALARHADKVVLGYYFHTDADEVAHLKPEQIKERVRGLAKFALPPIRYATPEAMDLGPLKALAPESNQPILNRAASAAGFFNIIPDEDGVVRRIPLVIQCGDRAFPSLALATFWRFTGLPPQPLLVREFGLESVELGPWAAPVDEYGLLRLNFRGGQAVTPTVEAADVLAGRTPRERLEGKAVVVAVTATGVQDLRTTPFASLEPGGMVQVQALDNLLTGDFVAKPGWSRIYDLLAVAGLGLAASLLCGWLPLAAGWLLALGLAVGYVVSAYYFFIQGQPLSVIHPLLGLAASGLGLTVFRNFTEVREKRRLRQAFGQYLHPSVVEKAVAEPGGLKLGGEKKVLTVLACDIRGFTSISEKLAPEQLAAMLNAHMDQMTAEVFAQEGLLDKFIGDAVMAVFGAPVEQPDHALRACRAALGMVRRADQGLARWESLGLPPLQIGVGLNSGPMVVGNMGSHARFDYTVIGDNVNTAFRVEGQCKTYGVSIIACASTRDACQDLMRFRVLDLIQVKGRGGAVAIHELVGARSDGPEPAYIALAEEAFQAYLRRDFAAAAALYQRILDERPEDKPSLVMRQRCLDYLANPPGPDWSGVDVKLDK
jgi:adenylate cyclase